MCAEPERRVLDSNERIVVRAVHLSKAAAAQRAVCAAALMICLPIVPGVQLCLGIYYSAPKLPIL